MRGNVKSITLFAGDRDFIDAINFVKHIVKKQMNVVAFQENLAQRIVDSQARIINFGILY